MLGRDNREEKHGNELLDKVLTGTKFISDIVSSTLGPRGRTVIVEKKYGLPEVTKDGVTVARDLHLEDSFENFGVQMVKQASVKSGDVGDGTTTTVLLAHTIFANAAAEVKKGANPVEVKKGIEAAVSIAVDNLKSLSNSDISAGDLEKVATISANSAEIGKIVSDAVSGDAKKVVTVEESGTMETSVDRTEGVRIPNGFMSHYFVTDPERYEAVLDDALIMLVEGKVMTQDQLIPAITMAVAELKNPKILVIAENVEDSAFAFLLQNRIKGHILPVAVKFAAFGNHRGEVLSDLAVLTGGRVFGSGGAELSSPKPTDFGRAKKVVVTNDSTVIVGGEGLPEAIATRKKELLAQIDDVKAQYDKERLKERFGRISGGVTVIKVGGATETEVNEKRARVEDAIQATQAACVDGVLPGGGTALAHVSEKIGPPIGTEDFKKGWNAVKWALKNPLAKILANAGKQPVVFADTLERAEDVFGTGYDVVADKIVDMRSIGVLDATKVVVSALQNAGSVAAALIGSEYAVTFKAKGDPKEAADAQML